MNRTLTITYDNFGAREPTATAANGATHMTLRNRGQQSGFARIAAPAMERAMRRANEKDLQRLKRLLETRQ